ncbi:MAG: rod shape-determining protein MreD [Limisphaerales bacterium]
MSREIQSTNGVTLLVFMITGYVIIFAQARFTFFRDFFGAQPDLLPGLIVFAAMAFRLETVMTCALVFGLLFDAFSLNALGTSVVTLGAIGFAASRYRELLLSEHFTTHWVLGLIASGVAPFVTYTLLRLSDMKPLIGAGSAWHWAVMTAGGGLVTPLWFKVFNRLDEALRYKEIPESAFRPDRQIARGRH